MGVLFSKPLTRKDLDAALDPIKRDAVTRNDLDAALDPINRELVAIKHDAVTKGDLAEALRPIMEDFLVPDGDQESRRITVTIKHSAEKSLMGHGAVVSMKMKRSDGEDPKNENKFYLLSAAHVIVDLALTEEKKKATVILIQHKVGDSIRCQLGDIFVPSDYIINGWNDCGFVELLNPPADWRVVVVETTVWTPTPRVGRAVVGHGQVFLRGTITGYDENNQNGRFSVLAHSEPGQSGCPLFHNDKAVSGVVHGSSKHRGKHAAGSHEGASIVYCDSVVFHDLIRVRDLDDILLLFYAEDIPEDVLYGPETVFGFLNDQDRKNEAQSLRTIVEECGMKLSDSDLLVTVMTKLEQKILGNSKKVSFQDAKLVLLEGESDEQGVSV